jgi:hypothetical protein
MVAIEFAAAGQARKREADTECNGPQQAGRQSWKMKRGIVHLFVVYEIELQSFAD